MGDKSPKSKERDKNQKKAVKTQQATTAKNKQDGQNRAAIPVKGKKER